MASYLQLPCPLLLQHVGLAANNARQLIGFNLLQSIRLLSDAINSFRQNLVVGLEPNRQQIQAFVERSLMLVTALTPRIGYEKASAIAQHEIVNNTKDS